MYVFIAIIFIAELVLAKDIICWIYRADKKVKALDKTVADNAPILLSAIKKFRQCICVTQDYIEKGIQFLEKKKIEFWQRIINLVLIYLILLIMKVKFKKAATYCQYAVFLKECWDSIPVVGCL